MEHHLPIYQQLVHLLNRDTFKPTTVASAWLNSVQLAAAKPNGVVVSPSKPVATTTYEPPSTNSKGKSAITSPPVGAIPTVKDVGSSSKPVAVLYSKPDIAKPPST